MVVPMTRLHILKSNAPCDYRGSFVVLFLISDQTLCWSCKSHCLLGKAWSCHASEKGGPAQLCVKCRKLSGTAWQRPRCCCRSSCQTTCWNSVASSQICRIMFTPQSLLCKLGTNTEAKAYIRPNWLVRNKKVVYFLPCSTFMFSLSLHIAPICS